MRATATPEPITAQRDLDRLVDEAERCSAVAFDTEFLREKTYRSRLCLVQLATPTRVAVVDPLGLDVAGIARLIASPDVEIVVHAGRQDFELFYLENAVTPARVFDVQIAAGFAGYGASLPYGRLVETVLGVALEKGESYSDWCRRPLSASQLRYAGDDVRYLLDVAASLKRRLAELGRLEWVADEMRALERGQTYEVDPGEAWRRVGGRGTLSGPQLALLKELARWREETAASRDIPRGWVLKDHVLVDLARRAPGDVGSLRRLRGIDPRAVDRYGPQLLEAIERGRRAVAPEVARAPARSAQIRARMLAALADALVRSRCEAAGVAPELVATREAIEALLLDVFSGEVDERRHGLLQGWRRKLVGDVIIDLARGRIAVKAVDVPPYIEEVPLDRRLEHPVPDG